MRDTKHKTTAAQRIKSSLNWLKRTATRIEEEKIIEEKIKNMKRNENILRLNIQHTNSQQ